MRATAKYVRVSPRKARLVAGLIRGKNVDDALSILRFTPNASARIFEKVLKSALANAQDQETADTEDLFVAEAVADPGPTLKRWRPRARGRATRILKRTSHIRVLLNRKES